MKISKTLLAAGLFIGFSAFAIVSWAEEIEPFYDGENVVGYIKDDKGNKYIVIETPDGKGKLIKTDKSPEEVLQDSYGITNKDFDIREE